MKLFIIILTLFLAQSSFGQLQTSSIVEKDIIKNSVSDTLKRKTLKVRKKTVTQSENISIKENWVPRVANISKRNNTPIKLNECDKHPWLSGTWRLKGFPDKTKNRNSIFDELYLINCTEARINYADLPTQKMSFTVDEANEKITFKSNSQTFEFSYTLKLSISKRWDVNLREQVTDTTFKRLRLYDTTKKISYYLIVGRDTDEHNYFPHVCKEADEHIHKWISKKTDNKGNRTRIKFNSCNQINVQYENTLLKNRIEAIDFEYRKGKNYISLKRQKLGVPTEFFDSEYQIEFKQIKGEDKLVLTNKKEALYYVVEK